MTYAAKKLVRDLGVTVLGVVLYFVGTQDLSVSPEVAAFVTPFALLGYRLLRERSETLSRFDSQGH